jgi:hypothetical protein
MARRPGEVREVIVEYLRTCKNQTATIGDIHAFAIDTLGGEPVSASSIRSSLQLCKDFERVGRGKYRLVRQ